MTRSPDPDRSDTAPGNGPPRASQTAIARPVGACDAGRLARQPELRQEIAAAAARWVAESGLDYGQAKQAAAEEVLDGAPMPRGMLPDNEDLDAALASHLDLFDADHADRVARMRAVALDLMQRLQGVELWVTGSVWKGIVADHVPIHLQAFHDDPKEVLLQLIDLGINFEAAELPALGSPQGGLVEAVQFEYRHEPVQIGLHPGNARHLVTRGADRTPERGHATALKALMEASQAAAHGSQGVPGHPTLQARTEGSS